MEGRFKGAGGMEVWRGEVWRGGMEGRYEGVRWRGGMEGTR